MKVTVDSFGALKVIDNETINSFVDDPNKVFERKYDGTAGIINVDENETKIYGRGKLKDGSQQDYTATFPDLFESIEYLQTELESFTLLGEIVVLNEEGNEYFKGIESRCNRKKDIEEYAEKFPAQFMIFDILSLEGDDLCHLNFSQRRNILEEYQELIEETDRLLLIEQFPYPIGKRNLLNRVNSGKYGMEGVVVKDLMAPYPNNSMKYKYKETQDVFWEGEYEEGNGKNAGKIGSLICYQYINGQKMQVAKVGGGLTDALRAELTQAVQEGKVTENNPWVIEVQTHELLASGKLRYPNWLRRRYDKSSEQCVRTLEIKETVKAKSVKSVKQKPEVKNIEPHGINHNLSKFF